MEKLLKYRYDPNEKCLGCMIGKSCRQDAPGPAKRADRPLGKVKFDLIISTITSVEGYNATALFVDDHTGHRWQYGCKTKDEAFEASQRWIAEIGDLREKYPLLVVMRDNAGENKSKCVTTLPRREWPTDIAPPMTVVTAYEQHQDGLSGSGIKSLFLLARSAMAESGLAGKYWFCAANCEGCRNAMYVESIKNTPWGLLYASVRREAVFVEIQTIRIETVSRVTARNC